MDISKITAEKVQGEYSTRRTTMGREYLIGELGLDVIHSILSSMIMPVVELERSIRWVSFEIIHWNIIPVWNHDISKGEVYINVNYQGIYDGFRDKNGELIDSREGRIYQSLPAERTILVSDFIMGYRNYQLNTILS